MNPFTPLTSIAIPLDRANVDTDAIIPKQFLKSIKRSGFGDNLFDEWRYLDKGEPDKDNSRRPLNPDFVLNNPKYSGAQILLTRRNFGCGSSREHAPWALLDYGIKVIIAPSFADIFDNNCFKNGLLPIVQSEQTVDWLFKIDEPISVDLPAQTLTVGGSTLSFTVDGERKRRLLAGLDDIALTMEHADKIRAFEKNYHAQYPWL